MIDTKVPITANLDIKLLADALVAQTRRLERFMREAEMPESWIRASTEGEYALANRCLMSLEGTSSERKIA